MTKSQKAKKARKALKVDFLKKKQKVGKKLRRPENETRTDFKARKIILKEQLARKNDSSLVTKKQYNIKELVGRLEHHNSSVRSEGVSGMQELITHNEVAELFPYLSKIILNVSQMILDPSDSVRRNAVNCIQALVTKLGPNLQPYFSMIATYLSCAMAHLNTSIQSDSLKLGNILVIHTPSLVSKYANILLKNFIDLISRKVSTHQSSGKTSDVTRKLHVNPDNALTGHTFHIKMLNQLSGFLGALLKEQQHTEAHIPSSMWQTVLVGSVPPLNFVESNKNELEGIWLFSDPDQLNTFSKVIIPLLFEVWAEVDPKSSGAAIVSQVTKETLECIMNIVKHMWDITEVCTQESPMKSEWVIKEFQAKFASRLMCGFPYLYRMEERKRKNKNKSNKTPNEEKKDDNDNEDDADENIGDCDSLNLMLCFFAMQLCPNKTKDRVISFLSGLLCDDYQDGKYKLESVVQMILTLLDTAQTSDVEKLVYAAQNCYSRLHPLRKDRAALLQILLAATDNDHYYMWKSEYIDKWIEIIVNDLENGQVTEPVLSTALALRLRGYNCMRSMLSTRKQKIREAVTEKGVKSLTKEQVENRLGFLLKDLIDTD